MAQLSRGPFCMSLAPVVASFLWVILTASHGTSGMQVDYYHQSCPHAERIAKKTLEGLLLSDVTATAALLRLVFHDCSVKACDASILLADDPKRGIESELHSARNFGIRKLNFIDIIKEALEHECPGVVSCADIIVLAARDAVALAGGPVIPVLTGRMDSMQAYKALADTTIPLGTFSVDQLLQAFSPMGLTVDETVALLGSHTLGVSHCVSFENRLKPKLDKTMNPALGEVLEVLCSGGGHSNIANSTTSAAFTNDATSLAFDYQYFRDVRAGRGLLTADAELAGDVRTQAAVKRYAGSQHAFFEAYTTAFLKLTQFAVLSPPDQGQIRKHCSRLN